MNIEIRGRTKTLCKAEIKFAAAFYAVYLMGEKLSKNLDLEIVFEDQGRCEGHASPLDDERKPRTFEIGINPNLKRRKMLQCLAHEMVHVKQYARGELSNELITAKWQGKTYKLSSSMEDYFNYPWEVEAFGRDRPLYMFYQVLLKSEKISFKNGKIYMNGKQLKLDKAKNTK